MRLLILLLSSVAWAQVQSVDFSAPPPTPVIIVSVNPTGVTGTTTYYYFVVASFPVGSAVSNPFQITNANSALSGSNFNTITWVTQLYATSYAVLRSTTNTISLPCNSCLVASGITGGSTTDTSNTVTSFNTTLATSANGYIRMNNRDFSAARLQTNLPFQTLNPTGLCFVDNSCITSAITARLIMFDVTTYGATNGGIIQTATNINAAIAACGAAGGGTVYFPGGTYLVSTQITANATNCLLWGNNREATIKKGGNFDLISISANGSGIVGLTLDGNFGGGFTGKSITSSDVSDVRILDNTIKNNSTTGITFSGVSQFMVSRNLIFSSTTSTDGFFGQSSLNNALADGTISNNQIDLSLTTTSNVAGAKAITIHTTNYTDGATLGVRNIVISNNVLKAAADSSNPSMCLEVGAFGGAYPVDVSVSGNTCVTNAASNMGYSFAGDTNLSFTGNSVWTNGLAPSSGLICFEFAYNSYPVATGNSCNNTASTQGGSGVGSNIGRFFSINGTSFGTFTGNTAYGLKDGGIGVNVVTSVAKVTIGAGGSITEAGNVLTVASTPALLSTTYMWPGAAVQFQGTSTALDSTWCIIQEVISTSAFKCTSSVTGIATGANVGTINSMAAYNTIASNTLQFGETVASVAHTDLIAITCTIATSYCGGNIIEGNTLLGNIAGTNLEGIYINAAGAAGTIDGSMIGTNNMTNLNLAIRISANVTNTTISPQKLVGIATRLTDGGTLTHNLDTPTLVLANDYTNATTGFTNVAFSFPVSSSVNYAMDCDIIYQAAATGGLQVEFTGPAGAAAQKYSLTSTLTSGASPTFYSAAAAAYSTSLGSAVVSAATDMPAHVHFGVLNGTTAGTVQMLAASSASVTLTIRRGSSCIVNPLY